MSAVFLKAHFEGNHIQLDEPYEIDPSCEIMVAVIPKDETFAQWREDWFRLASRGLARAYGPDEPEYTEADCIP